MCKLLRLEKKKRILGYKKKIWLHNCFRYPSHTHQKQTKLGLKLTARSGCSSISEQMWDMGCPPFCSGVSVNGRKSVSAGRRDVQLTEHNSVPAVAMVSQTGMERLKDDILLNFWATKYPPLALVLIFQLRWGENRLKMKVPKQHFLFQNSEHFLPITVFFFTRLYRADLRFIFMTFFFPSPQCFCLIFIMFNEDLLSAVTLWNTNVSGA